MKRIVISINTFLFAIIVPIILMTSIMDPSNLFERRATYFQYADILNRGIHIIGLDDFNERLLCRLRIENRDTFPANLIIGSSRVMLINEDIFGDKLMNLGTSGGSVEDLETITNLLIEKDVKVDKIIIEAYPWLFNINNKQNNWIENEDLTDGYKFHSFQYYKNIVTQYGSLVDPSYFKASVIKLIKEKGLQKKQRIYFSRTINTSQKVNFASGAIRYDSLYRHRDVDKMINIFLSGEIYSMGNFDQIDNVILDRFVKVIRKAKSISNKVILFKSPYPETVEKVLYNKPEYSIIRQVDKTFETVALRESLDIIGSFKSSYFQLSKDEFYDGMHCKEKGLKRIFEQSFKKLSN